MVGNEAIHDPADAEAAQEQAPKRRLRRYLAPTLLALALIAATLSAGFAGNYFWSTYQYDRQTDDAVAHRVIQIASDGAVALLTYSPDTLGKDVDNAKSRVTDRYLIYYQQFAEKILGMTAMRGQVTTSATTIRAAVEDLQPKSAVVLVFVKWKTSSKEKPQPVTTSGKLKVSLAKIKDSWLIDKVESL